MPRRRAAKSGRQQVVVIAPKKTKKNKKSSDEVTRLGNALRALGSLGGGAIGNLVGYGSEGRGVGRSIGASISKWLGSGDYQVSTNTMLSPSGSVPMMHKSQQSIVVRHREFVTSISGATDFTVRRSLILNPGIEGTFPWLSRIAANFQEYRIKGMVFHYIPSSGDAVSSTNPALGTVMFQTSYRSTDTAPSTKLELLNEYWASENVPSQAFCHPIECDPKENPFNVQYIRTGALPGTDNQLMYDLGTTHIAVSGMQVDYKVVGDVWVTYEVELKKPLISSNATALTNYYGAVFNSIAGKTFNGDPLLVDSYSNFNVIPVDNTITFPLGVTGIYQLSLVWYPSSYFSAFSGLNTTLPTVVGGVPMGYVSSPYATYPAIQSGNVGGSVIYAFRVAIEDPSTQCVITVASSNFTIASSGTAEMRLSVSQLA